MWLMLLALPLQGYAAAVGLHCGPQPQGVAHGSIDASVTLVTLVTLVTHDASAATPACHGGASTHPIGTVSKFKCSACAACCFAAAFPSSALTFESVAPVTSPVFAAPAPVVGFFTDGPDRPPRSLLS